MGQKTEHCPILGTMMVVLIVAATLVFLFTTVLRIADVEVLLTVITAFEERS